MITRHLVLYCSNVNCVTELALKRLLCIIQTSCGLQFCRKNKFQHQSLCANKGQTSPAAASQCQNKDVALQRRMEIALVHVLTH